MNKFILLLSVLVLFLVSPSQVFAQVVINEVYPNPPGSSEPDEFIELFNSGSDFVDITSWTISDTVGSVKAFTIPSNILPAGSYISFRRLLTSIILNNDGDGVVLKDVGANIIDSMTFGTSAESYSWSRVPDGSGSFVGYTLATEGLPNPTATPSPIPTPSPSPSPSPEPTAQPTSSPSPTKSPSPTPVVTKSPSPKPDVTKSPSSTPTSSGLVLGVENIKTPQTSPVPHDISEKSSPILAIALVSAGVGLMGFSGYLAFKKQKETLPQNKL